MMVALFTTCCTCADKALINRGGVMDPFWVRVRFGEAAELIIRSSTWILPPMTLSILFVSNTYSITARSLLSIPHSSHQIEKVRRECSMWREMGVMGPPSKHGSLQIIPILMSISPLPCRPLLPLLRLQNEVIRNCCHGSIAPEFRRASVKPWRRPSS
jgi:hypothetical protein